MKSLKSKEDSSRVWLKYQGRNILLLVASGMWRKSGRKIQYTENKHKQACDIHLIIVGGFNKGQSLLPIIRDGV